MKKLIQTDQQKANTYISLLNNTKPLLQKVVDEIRVIGVALSINEINVLITALKQNSMTDQRATLYVEDIIRERIVQTAESTSIGSIKVSKEKLKYLLDMPNCNSLTSALLELQYKISYTEVGMINLNYFEVVDYTVTIKNDTESLINQMFSIYALSEKEDNLFTLANEIATKLNDIDKMNIIPLNISKQNIDEQLPFLRFDNAYRVNVGYIHSLFNR